MGGCVCVSVAGVTISVVGGAGAAASAAGSTAGGASGVGAAGELILVLLLLSVVYVIVCVCVSEGVLRVESIFMENGRAHVKAWVQAAHRHRHKKRNQGACLRAEAGHSLFLLYAWHFKMAIHSSCSLYVCLSGKALCVCVTKRRRSKAR